MPAKTLSIVSAVLTIILLILIGIFLFFMTLVALNGFGDREGTAAVTITLICQGIGVIISALLAGSLTRRLIEKFNWNKALAVILSIFAGTTLGTILAFGALALSIFAAGALWQMR
jgi:hypothetical protein